MGGGKGERMTEKGRDPVRCVVCGQSFVPWLDRRTMIVQDQCCSQRCLDEKAKRERGQQK